MIQPILPQDVARCIGHGAGPSGYQNRIDDEPEEWRPLFGRYCISSHGRVMGMHKIRKMQLGTNGYGLAHTSIRNIKAGRTWKNLPD